MKKTLGIIYGGKSSEHEVSLRTAFSIMEAIDYLRYEVVPIYIDIEGQWAKGEKLTAKPLSVESLRLEENKNSFSVFALKQELDVFFPVVHGPFGEDGTLQGMLEMIDVPYVGSDVLASAVGMDKVMMKNLFEIVSLPQCKFLWFTRKEISLNAISISEQIEESLGYPCFVKPVNLGSSVGISKAKDRESLLKALALAASYDRKVIIEEFVEGRELEIGVLGNEELKTSVVGEIISAGEFYDYAAKYKNIGTKLEIPAKVPASVVERIEETAKRAFLVLECSGISRIDFFWDDKEDKVYINEINTMPGFTPFSMYPLLFKEAGISYPELIEELIELALEAYEERQENQITVESLE